MTGIATFQDAVIAGLKAQVPELKSIGRVEGQITQDSIRRLSVRSPGALVAITGIQGISRMGGTGRYRGDAIVVCFLWTEGRDRIQEAVYLCEKITLAVLDNTWQHPFTDLPKELEMENLFDDEIVKSNQNKSKAPTTGVLLTAVSWKQSITVERARPFVRTDDQATDLALGAPQAGVVPSAITVKEVIYE